MGIFFVPPEHVDFRSAAPFRGGTQDSSSNFFSFLGDCTVLFQNKIYILIVVALSALYFVVSGVQFWATAYLIADVNSNEYLVMSLFVLTCSSAPILGVFFGGWYIDKHGGYQGVIQRTKALKTLTLMSIAAIVFSFAASLFTILWPIVGCIWALLFFGGAILPCATGTLLNLIPSFRPCSSCFKS